MTARVRIAMFGSSLVSAYWNGAATYYRGILKALHDCGFDIEFYEPDAYNRQEHRDIPDPPYAKVVVYSASTDGVADAIERARTADVLIKASGVGANDELLEAEIPRAARRNTLTAFWDVDAPATLERMRLNTNDPFRRDLPEYDLVLTYGGGPPVVDEYERVGAKRCVPIYNALDPDTHHPVPHDGRFDADLGFLGNRLPDREARVREFFLEPAKRLPQRRFLLGGSGWDQGIALPENVNYIGHVYTRDHNAFNCSPRAVLNINRDSMAKTGFSPPTRVFEAAGAGACLLCDAWEGIEQFLEPEREVLCVRSGEEVQHVLAGLSESRARAIGEAARGRVLSEHTYEHRAVLLRSVLKDEVAARVHRSHVPANSSQERARAAV
jgi:spore maturation protein CgeB